MLNPLGMLGSKTLKIMMCPNLSKQPVRFPNGPLIPLKKRSKNLRHHLKIHQTSVVRVHYNFITFKLCPIQNTIWIFKNTYIGSKITKIPNGTSHEAPPPPTPKEREGSSMLTWDPCRRQRKKQVPISMCRVPGDFFIVFHLDIFCWIHSQTHTFFFGGGCFKTEIL